MMMKDGGPLRLTLQKQHPQTHASASVSTTPSAKLRLSGARRSCSLRLRHHLQASWISRAGAAAARFPAGGPPRLYQERQVRRRGSRQSPELGALGLPKFFAPDRTITPPIDALSTGSKGNISTIDISDDVPGCRIYSNSPPGGGGRCRGAAGLG